ncbi:MAG: PIN domain-containing protein [Syntrophomonadaceae bacterium]|nr:PIN domain-containing protein [Syntrophomonadaceae bacterium]
MVKKYIIDSSVLLYSSDSILSFAENIVIVPEAVIEEIRSFAWEKGDLGDRARKAQVLINHLIAKGKGGKPVRLLNGGIFKVEMNHNQQKLPRYWDPQDFDNRLLQVCLALQEKNHQVVLVTRDILTRIKADILGIPSQDFEDDTSLENKSPYNSRYEVVVSSADVDAFFRKGYLNPDRLKAYTDKSIITPRRWQMRQREDSKKAQKLG